VAAFNRLVSQLANRASLCAIYAGSVRPKIGDIGNTGVLVPESSRQSISSWSRSPAKRVFDCICILLAFPVLAPLALVVAVSVRLTSAGPVLFLQERVGRHGRIFTIFKFRTMVHAAEVLHRPITTLGNQRFTPVGPFLRRWKLDELPQLANVLLGHMSLVGPRPKMLEHTAFSSPCRPGLTGLATLAFAEEEAIFSRLRGDQLDACFYSVVLPAKQQMDAEYAARATLLSDLRILVNSTLRRWDTAAAEKLIGSSALDNESAMRQTGLPNAPLATMHNPMAAPAISLGL